ncbi:TPA: FkbM family methyltransferase [Vibrio cholerae]|nr:FkbM family methyltransferase [Vibrio cholerae]
MSNIRKVKSRRGQFNIISSDKVVSESIALYGEWAQIELEILEKFIEKGDTVIDVGAYLGTHALAFSDFVGNGEVIAFEARKNIFDILEQNTNARDNIRIVNSALGKRYEKMDVESYSLSENENFGSFSLEVSNNPSQYQTVIINRLDSFGISSVDFIKIDVEGMEYDVLLGAERTISANRPHIFLEINSVDQAVSIFSWANENNYQKFGIVTSAFNHSNYNKESINIFGDASETGMLLVCKDKLHKYLDVTYSEPCICNIESIDDVVLLMLSKRQYSYEILSNSAASEKLSLEYFSPRLIKLEEENSLLNELHGNLIELEKYIENIKSELNICKSELDNHNSLPFLIKKLSKMIFKRSL